ncbi:hypothetical protein [Christiangramia salexigens]|uniref:Uncharacterized protein n=1 Tax=Christiangramia salexigens TaxID=1913577 RepID=A0A1L3J7S3_9FLAO|nr:hypothetical protein [Christiangramia salexigens]APG61144.1 hypothetical protein LPB144_12360 [Christiangramia salexigens]
MPRLKSLRILLSALAVGLMLTSCFKDVDFSQSQNIALKPDIETGLLYYQLNENDFLDSQTNNFTPVIRDTVDLEFLDDDYIQDGLMYAEFRFRHENTFDNRIKSKIRFLNKNGRTEFEVLYEIPAGSYEFPGVIDTILVMEGENIEKVRRSFPMAVELEMIDGGEKIKGELGFSSKALFKFEF